MPGKGGTPTSSRPRAVRREGAPPATGDAADFLPPAQGLDALRAAAARCRGCELFRRATQTVFGEGHDGVRLMLVGEQPGDQEDRAGRPFVGPAGQLLDEALARAGLARDTVYVTNAVKHFKWVARGPRRLHQAPAVGEIAACRAWLVAEVQAVRPAAIVCLGATAMRAVFARAGLRVGALRGGPHQTALAQRVFVTIHPAAILRLPEAAMRDAEFARLVDDLQLALRATGPGATN